MRPDVERNSVLVGDAPLRTMFVLPAKSSRRDRIRAYGGWNVLPKAPGPEAGDGLPTALWTASPPSAAQVYARRVARVHRHDEEEALKRSLSRRR